MDAVTFIVSAVLALGTPAAVVGGITALVVRSSATSKGRTPPEVGRQALRGFWIAFAITVALEILLVGLCVAAFTNAYGAT